MHMEFILFAGYVGVFVLVWRRNQQQTTRSEYPLDFAQHVLVPIMVFDSFKTYYQIHRGVFQRDFGCVALPEGKIGSGILC